METDRKRQGKQGIGITNESKSADKGKMDQTWMTK